MSELKAGDSIDYQVGDKTLTIEPVPYGNIKQILKIALGASKAISAGELTNIPEVIDQNINSIFPLMFVKGKYPFLTGDWIENSITVPVLRKMMEAAVVVNGLQDFFDKAGGKMMKSAGAKTIPPTQATPPENPGSTTSSDSPTDGVLKT